MSLSAGSKLGPYEIGGLLGSGGMGEVYRARDTKLGRAVAIKVLPEAFAFDPDRVARFEREAKVLASLNHPHIAALHGMELSVRLKPDTTYTQGRGPIVVSGFSRTSRQDVYYWYVPYNQPMTIGRDAQGRMTTMVKIRCPRLIQVSRQDEIVDAGGGIEKDVDVLLLPAFVAALRKDVVDLHGRDGAHLPLNADRILPAAVDVVRRRLFQFAVAPEQTGCGPRESTRSPRGEVGGLFGRLELA